MNWKNWSYWVKGGIIAVIIFIIFEIIGLIINPYINCPPGSGDMCIPLWMVPLLIGFFAYFNSIYLVLAIGFILAVTLSFIIGALLSIILRLIFLWLRRDKYALYGGLIAGSIFILLGILSIMFSPVSELLFGRGSADIIEITIPVVIALVIGTIIGGVVGLIAGKIKQKRER